VSHTEEYHGKQGDYTNKCTQVTACCQRWPTIRFICIDSYSYRRNVYMSISCLSTCHLSVWLSAWNITTKVQHSPWML